MSPSRLPHMSFNRTEPSTGQPTNLFGSSVAGPEKADTDTRHPKRALSEPTSPSPEPAGKPMQTRNAEPIKHDAAYM